MEIRKEEKTGGLRVILLILLFRFTQQQGSNLTDDYDYDSSEAALTNDSSYEDDLSEDFSNDSAETTIIHSFIYEARFPHGNYDDYSTDNEIHEDDSFPGYALLEEYEKKCKEVPTTDPRCGCDPDCAKYGDCCLDSIYFKAEEQNLGASTASCYIGFSKHFYIMTRCPSEWENPQTRNLCERPDFTFPNPLLDTLVTSIRTNVTYRNSYCASCHNDLHQDMFTWPLEVSCEFDPYKFRKVDNIEYFQRMFYDGNTSTWYFDLSGLEMVQCVPCDILLTDAGQSYTVSCPSPSPAVFSNGTKTVCKLNLKWDERMSLEGRLRACEYSISWCPSHWNNATERELCEAYNAHVSHCGTTYRNYHCAYCHNKMYDTPCYDESEDEDPIHPPFSVLLHVPASNGCINNEVYDSLSHKCLEILPHQAGTRMDDGHCTNVTFSKEEYILAEENNTVFLPSLKATYYQHEFYIQDDLVVLCLPAKPAIRFSSELGYITTAGLSLSIICILLHLTVLCLVPKQLNLPAMNLASLCVSLLLLYSSFIASGSVYPGTTSCVVIAVAMHYGLVASFFWMLIISFDIFNMTRRTQTKLVALKGVQLGRFIMYSTTGWVIPAIIAGSAVLLDHVVPSSSFSPAYGKNRCWFNHSNALLLFCLTPLIFVMSLNVIFFVWTSYLIHQMRHSIKTPASYMDFKLNLRLFIIMGLMWITGISAAAFNTEVLWYIFVILNTTQGVFIFIAFTCKKKIRQELQNLFKRSTSFSRKSIPSGTENTNIQ